MKEPGLDGRHRDKPPPKAGQIQQKRSDTQNKNLPKAVPQFSPNATLQDDARRRRQAAQMAAAGHSGIADFGASITMHSSPA
jgi:hypothetical protein